MEIKDIESATGVTQVTHLERFSPKEVIMAVTIDSSKGKLVAELLCRSFDTVGIHGRSDMPEDQPPTGVKIGSTEHVLFLTLTVAIDYQRDAPALWDSSRKTFEDPQTAYIFDPKTLHETPFGKVVSDMQKHGLSKKPTKDAQIWRTVGITFLKKWSGDPRSFLQDCGWDCPAILARLKRDTHLYNGRMVPDYPFLRGDKIGPLWLRMLRDNARISDLKSLHTVPIPVDIHVARATLSLGIISGKFSGRLSDLFSQIREAWFESVRGLVAKGRPMIALDVDEPLWHLSKYGCSFRDGSTGMCLRKKTCEVREFCADGLFKIDSGKVELDS